ncbi:hypothetical protein HRED_00813 [Candidatus Haloredivivus sp. G17]|nr:hypothetical protein HRED_00813 [Candidatus Haloredivivus sp. G17]
MSRSHSKATSRVTQEEVSNERLMKKLNYIQERVEENSEVLKENKKKLNKIEEAIRPEGGIQPSKKGLKILDKEENSQDLFTDVGKEIYQKLMKQNSLTRNDLEEILIKYDMSRSKPTYLKYLKDIAAELNAHFDDISDPSSVEYKKGTQGGKNGGRPSRILIN